MKKILNLTLISTLLLLSACGSVPVTQYYSLPETGLPKQATNHRAVLLKVNIISFLDTTSMAYQLNDVTLNFSTQNLWVQTPKEGIAQSLVNKLNRNSSGGTLFVLSDSKNQTNNILTVTINRFYGRFDGMVAVSGFFQLTNAQQQVTKTESFDFLIPQEQDGYVSMVKALDKGLDGVSQTISGNL